MVSVGASPQVEGLDQLALELACARDPGAVHAALHRFIAATTPMTGLLISRYDAERRVRRCVYAHSDGQPVDAASLPELPLNGSPNSRAIETASPVLEEDYVGATAKVPVSWVGDLASRPCVSLAVPMMSRGQVLGLLTIQSTRPKAFGERDIAFLRVAADLAALAIENIELLEAQRKANASLEERIAERSRDLEQARGELQRQAVQRTTVRRILQQLSARTQARPEALRELGRDIAGSLAFGTIAEAAEAYTAMGLGLLKALPGSGERAEFVGHDLVERGRDTGQPTCYLALGFVEGAVTAATGRPSLAAEVACQSRGQPACRFLVAPRVGK